MQRAHSSPCIVNGPFVSSPGDRNPDWTGAELNPNESIVRFFRKPPPVLLLGTEAILDAEG